MKTLKDLGLSSLYFKFDEDNMKRLKHLTENERLDFTAGTFNYHSEGQLKQEAIKWIKKLKKSDIHDPIYWIKHFFSISFLNSSWSMS